MSAQKNLGSDKKLSLIQAKIERAKEHFLDLHTEIAYFINSDPHKIVAKKDAQTGKVIGITFLHVSPTPARIPLLAGDTIQNLRSALDHLAHQLWLMTPCADPNVYVNFPITNSAKQLKAELCGKVQRFREDAKNVILRIEPYKQGEGHQFWLLNRLNNIDKHRLLLACSTGGRYLGDAVHLGTDDVGAWHFYIPDESTFEITGTLKAGDEILFPPSRVDIDDDHKFGTYVSFNEPTIVEGKSIIERIQNFVDLVAATVDNFRICLR